MAARQPTGRLALPSSTRPGHRMDCARQPTGRRAVHCSIGPGGAVAAAARPGLPLRRLSIGAIVAAARPPSKTRRGRPRQAHASLNRATASCSGPPTTGTEWRETRKEPRRLGPIFPGDRSSIGYPGARGAPARSDLPEYYVAFGCPCQGATRPDLPSDPSPSVGWEERPGPIFPVTRRRSVAPARGAHRRDGAHHLLTPRREEAERREGLVTFG